MSSLLLPHTFFWWTGNFIKQETKLQLGQGMVCDNVDGCIALLVIAWKFYRCLCFFFNCDQITFDYQGWLDENCIGVLCYCILLVLLLLIASSSSTCWSFIRPAIIVLRALASVELNSYNAILAPPKYQKQPCNSGGIVIIFSWIVTVHIYL